MRRAFAEMIYSSARRPGFGRALLRILQLFMLGRARRIWPLERLAFSAQIPAGVTYGGLTPDPEWDVLRSDPCFEKIVTSLAPK